jgi:hypothetical protein
VSGGTRVWREELASLIKNKKRSSIKIRLRRTIYDTATKRPGVPKRNRVDNNNVELTGINRRAPRALRVGGCLFLAAKKPNGNNWRGPAPRGEGAVYALLLCAFDLFEKRGVKPPTDISVYILRWTSCAIQ